MNNSPESLAKENDEEVKPRLAASNGKLPANARADQRTAVGIGRPTIVAIRAFWARLGDGDQSSRCKDWETGIIAMPPLLLSPPARSAPWLPCPGFPSVRAGASSRGRKYSTAVR